MTYEQAGIAAMLPGMIHMQELMQKEIERMKHVLLGLQNGNGNRKGRGRGSYWAEMTPEERSEEMRRRSRNRKTVSYWDKMTPEERSKEMKRRLAKARRNGASAGGGASPNHPSNPSNPGHEAWLKKMRTVRRAAA